MTDNPPGITRRRMLGLSAVGFTSLALLRDLRAQQGLTSTDPLAKAGWLRDPRFQGIAMGPLIKKGPFKDVTIGAGLSNPHNLHTYFRKEIVLAKTPTKAVLHITGDDAFKFYINGKFCVQGPERGYPFAYPYYSLPVTEMLKAGPNTLAAHVYYHGIYSRAYNSGDARSGLILALDVTYADGSTQQFVTDDTWKCLPSETFSATGDYRMGYGTQFNENMDLRKEPAHWRDPGFSDATWPAPLVERQDHVFIPAIAATLMHWRAEPVITKEVSPGRWFYDFGKELVGHTHILLKGNEGHVITVLHGEELNTDGSARSNMRAACNYEDAITLSGREDEIEFYDYRGFRYVEVLNAPVKPEVWVDVRHYPYDVNASSFECSEPLLNDIWQMCAYGIQIGCQDIFVDCPTREKGQYIGDTYLTVLSQLILTGDPALTRKALRDFQLTQRWDDGLLCVAPSSYYQELAEWSLLWPVMLHYYYWMTGDEAFTRKMAEAGLKKLTDWFATMENADGLLAGMDRRKWVLVDWPSTMRDNYDMKTTANGVNTALNAFYYSMLETAAELTRLTGKSDATLVARMKRVRKAMDEQLLDPATNLYFDGLNTKHQALHASGFPLAFGVVPEKARQPIVEFIRKKRLACCIYGAPYFIEGLYKVQEKDLAYDLLTSRDKNSWAEMLRNGATTPLESWAPEQRKNLSFCHPAAGTPVYLIARYLMGLSPAKPGWREVAVAPQIPEKLKWAKLRFPTVAGPISADYDQKFGYTITVPKGVTVKTKPTPGMRFNVRTS